MYCTKCGTKIDDDALFCTFCGQKVESDLEVDTSWNKDSSSENTTNIESQDEIKQPNETEKQQEPVEEKISEPVSSNECEETEIKETPVQVDAEQEKEITPVVESLEANNELEKETTPVIENPEPNNEPKKETTPVIGSPKPKKDKQRIALIAAIIVVSLLIIAAVVCFFVPELGIRCLILGHKTSDYIIDEDSTCVADGHKHIECVVCHKTMEEESIDKISHNYVDGHCTICGVKDTSYTESYTETYYSELFYVNTIDGLFLRERPTTSSNPILLMPINTRVVWLESDGEWFKTIVAGKTGWCSSRYLDYAESALSISCPVTETFEEMCEHHLQTRLEIKKAYGNNFKKGDAGTERLYEGHSPYMYYDNETTPIRFYLARQDHVQGDSDTDSDYISKTGCKTEGVELFNGIKIGDTISDIENAINAALFVELISPAYQDGGVAQGAYETSRLIVNNQCVTLYFDYYTHKLSEVCVY